MDKKKLNLFDLISIGIGCIIGAGIFSMTGYGIAYTGRGIFLAFFIAMFLVVMQSIRSPIISTVFDADGGTYAMNGLVVPRVCAGMDAINNLFFKLGSQSVTAIAFTMYLEILFPSLVPYRKLVAILVLTAVFGILSVGQKFAARVQDVMCVCMYVALAIFVFYGAKNYNPAAYAGEPFLMNGFSGLMMASALMSYTCNGFQVVVSVGRGAENPRRDIPRGYFISAFLAAGIYAVIAFVATHMFSYGEIAGRNLGDLAQIIMPNGMYMFFVVGGALFALGTSLLGNITGGYRPLMVSARDGWLPAVIGKETKKGVPYILWILWALSVIPVLLGWDLNDLVTMQLVPLGTIAIINSILSIGIPDRFAKEWKESGMKMSTGVFNLLMVLSAICSGILVAYAFLSNGYKLVTLGITAFLIGYAIVVDKFGHVDMAFVREYEAAHKN